MENAHQHLSVPYLLVSPEQANSILVVKEGVVRNFEHIECCILCPLRLTFEEGNFHEFHTLATAITAFLYDSNTLVL